jgi:hypothetical protein
VLYGAHAILLLAGAPVAFPPRWHMLDLVVPVFGYGLIAILVGHMYSRYALRKLQRIARSGLDPTAEEPQDDGA